MSSRDQPSSPPGNLPGSVPTLDVSNHTDPPVLPSSQLDQLPDQIFRLVLHLKEQLHNIFSMVGGIQRNLQEQQEQVESFLKLMKACSGHLGTTESAKTQASQVSPGKETQQTPQVKPIGDHNLKAIVTSWLSQQPAFTAKLLDSLEPQPSWDRAPEFWQDLLSGDLWKVFADLHKKEQPAQRVTEQVLDLQELSDPELRGSRTDADPQSTLSHLAPTLAQPLSSFLRALNEGTSKPHGTQAPARSDSELLQFLSWDPEDVVDGWKWLAVPQALHRRCVLEHGQPLLAVALSSFLRHAFTCARGGIKVWSLVGQVAKDRFPESHLRPSRQTHGAYLRTCQLSIDSRTLFAGGHNLPSVSVWDLAAPSIHEKQQLPCEGLSCQVLAASPDDSLAFAGFTNGTIRMWDMYSQSVVRDLSCHGSEVKSLVVKEYLMWAGCLDGCLRCWDLRDTREPLKHTFESQIMSLSHSPQEDDLLLGMADGQHWIHSADGQQQRLPMASKDKMVLGVKFSPNGQWFVSVGMDNFVTVHSMPMGAKVFQVCEATSVMCCDVSSDSRLVLTGSGNHASVYQVTY